MLWRRRRRATLPEIIFAVVGAVFLFIARPLPDEWQNWYRLRQPGTLTVATVVDRSTYRGNKNSLHYQLSYRYRAGDGVHTVTVSDVTRARYDASPLNLQVPIKYAAVNPEAIAIVKPLSISTFVVTATLTIAAIMAFAWFMMGQIAIMRSGD